MTSTLRMHCGMWRLARRVSWRPETDEIDMFESHSINACQEYDAYLNGYDACRDNWWDQELNKVYPTKVPDILAYVSKCKGTGTGQVEFVQDNKRRVGQYKFEMTDERACYMAGAMTICGSSWLEEDLRGKGLGLAMYDIAVAASGMDCVPQGRDFVDGGLTPDSTAFWEKRRTRQQVPTDTSEALVRKQFVQDGTGVIMLARDNSSGNGSGIAALIALAHVARGQLFAVVVEGRDGKEKFGDLWVVLEDKRRMDMGGIMTQSEGDRRMRKVAQGRTVTRVGPISVEDVCVINACREDHRSLVFARAGLANALRNTVPAVDAVVRRYLPGLIEDDETIVLPTDLIDIPQVAAPEIDEEQGMTLSP